MPAKVWIWGLASFGSAGIVMISMLRPEVLEHAPLDRTIFLPGATSDGHYQIELACDACHAEAFGDMTTMQDACVDCHGAELERVDDSHPQRKFTDPRNADRVASLDARWCVTCHQEHRPELTSSMGLSLPGDYCHRCHEDVGDERPTHRGLHFDGCASSGCHNFHDNRALYEDFLVTHRDEPWLLESPRSPQRARPGPARARGFAGAGPLGAAQADARPDLDGFAAAVADWVGTAHAQAGVNCGDCHVPEDGAEQGAWVERPEASACAGCHDLEHEGFLAGRHGMRLSAGLPAMTPGEARLPMLAAARDASLGCQSCHAAHAYETRTAAAEACLGCHADDHSVAFEASTHGVLWAAEQRGVGPPGSGVSCATCHLPRIRQEDGPIRVAHNQNDTLRPSDKMVRPVCLDCHGLGFSLDALADDALVRKNFDGRPSGTVDSIHFATVLRWELEGKRPPWQDQPPTEEQEHEEIDR